MVDFTIQTLKSIDETNGYGCFNYLVTFMTGLVLLHVMMECLGVGYITMAAASELNLTAKEIGLINSAAFFGIILTALFWGYLGDNFGRRRVMLPAIFASCAASFGSTMATNFGTFFVLRMLTGCLVSASSATIFAYIGELHSTAKRDTVILFASTSIAFTFIVLPILGWLILSGSWTFKFLHLNVRPWRVYIWSWSLCGLSAAFILIFLPESPRYLLVAKGPEEARTVLAGIYAWNKRKKKEDYPVETITGGSIVASRHGFKVAFRNLALFTKFPLRRCVMISHMCMFMIFMQINGLCCWLPDILHGLFTNINRQVSLCQVMMAKYKEKSDSVYALADTKNCAEKDIHYMVYPTSIIIGILTAVVFITTGYIVAKCSKIKLYCAVVASGSIMLAVSGVLEIPVLAVILFVIGLCCGTMSSLLATVAVQVFPTNIRYFRALALCTMYMCGRLGAAVGGNLLGLAVRMHCELIFLIATLATAASVLLMLLWPDPMKVRSEMESKGYTY